MGSAEDHSLKITLVNEGNNDISIYNEGVSHGYFNIKFIFSDGINEYLVYRKPKAFERNIASFNSINSKSRLSRHINFKDGTWVGFDNVMNLKNKIYLVRAVFDQNNSNSSVKLWDGIIKSDIIYVNKVFTGFRKPVTQNPNLELVK